MNRYKTDTEEDYKKMPNAVGKMNVLYSDGAIKKLGEKYEPIKTRWIGDSKTGYETTKGGLVNEPESDTYGKSDWKEWHKSKYPERYKTQPQDKK